MISHRRDVALEDEEHMTDVHILAIDLAKRSFQVCATAVGGACVDAPVLQGDFRTFLRRGASIARVSGLLLWPDFATGRVCSSKNEVHIGSESFIARAPGLVCSSWNIEVLAA